MNTTQTQVRTPGIRLPVVPFTYQVSPQPGCYLVTEMGPAGVRIYRVGKDKTCTCSTGGNGNGRGPYCRHVRAVKQYLQAGGSRAPEVQTSDNTAGDKPLVQQRACPICGTLVRQYRPYRNRYTGQLQEHWACPGDVTHYWQWRRSVAQARGESPTAQAEREERRRRLVEMYRTSGASEERIAAFLDESWSERQAFRERARARLMAWEA